MPKIRIPPKVAGFAISSLMKLLGATWRLRIVDRCGLLERETSPAGPVIWLVWHNRIFTAPVLQWRRLRHRQGSVLTSASKDGDVLAAVCGHFGIKAVRGSSSKRAAAALIQCIDVLKGGDDLCITPDGPRGPKYKLQPGLLLMSQRTGAPIMPIHLRPRSAWRLKTWDAFMIPKPFTRIDVELGPFLTVPPTDSPDSFEAERTRLESLMRAGTGEAE